MFKGMLFSQAGRILQFRTNDLSTNEDLCGSQWISHSVILWVNSKA
jgi:hypothetical protein